jgi:hypothetical protein
MARAPADIDTIISEAIADAMKKIGPALQRHVAALLAEGLDEALALGSAPPRRAAPRRTRPRTEITKWVADRNARRVPIFVIEATGLDTKKAIVAKFGENATFEKGKGLPKPAKAA